MAFGDKKPGISILLGIKKKAPLDDSAPPSMNKPPMPGIGDTPDEAGDTDDKTGAIPPEAVSYRTSDMKCSGCEYMQGSDCTKLQMPVEPDAGCNLFESKSGEGEQPMGEEMPDMAGAAS